MITAVYKPDMPVATGSESVRPTCTEIELTRDATVTYLFRTTGQVLGVSLGGAITQAVLLARLKSRISGPDADKVRQYLRSLVQGHRLTRVVFVRCSSSKLFGMFRSFQIAREERRLTKRTRRHTTLIIPSLDPPIRQAAIDSYADALRVVFICQTLISILSFICCIPIEERPMAP